jgi:hypothetical protein
VNIGAVNTISIGIADAFDSVGDAALLIRQGSLFAAHEPSALLPALAGLAFLGLVRRRSGTSVARTV